MSLSSQVDYIARLSLHDPKYFKAVALPQAAQRIKLVERWDVKPGERILELGCGQGDCTAVLAVAVGSHGHVTAVDPGPPDYGAPYTLAQAQSHLSGSPVGSCITWINADPTRYLNDLPADEPPYDAAVLANCIWYMSTPSVLADILKALKPRVKRVCVAEYALASSDPAAFPHILATLTQASLECRKPTSTSNVRTVLSPEAIKAIILGAAQGLDMDWEDVVVPTADVLDGKWEINAVMGSDFGNEVESSVKNEREKAVIYALRDAVKDAVKGIAPARPRTMDVWIASYSFHTRI